MSRLLIAAIAAVALIPGVAGAAILPRAKLTITSAIAVDTTNHTVTLPLHRAVHGATSVWYVVTDASTLASAKHFGVNYAPSLRSVGATMRVKAKRPSGTLVFPAVPGFAPVRTYIAGAGGFPPKRATPGSLAGTGYSPFIAMANGTVLDAPVVAVGTGPFDVTRHTNTEDRVIAIDTKAKTVTLVLARGFFNGKPVYYFSTDASNPVAAAVERSTYVPMLAKASPSAEIPIGVVVDGPEAGASPQGLAYLALRTPLGMDATRANAATIGSPFNLLSIAPVPGKPNTNSGYTPLWNVEVVKKRSVRATSFAQIAADAKPAGFVVNCPVVAYGDDSSY